MSDTRPPAPDDGITVRPFADFLLEASQGKTHNELSEGLRDLVARVTDTGKKGSITLVVAIEPVKGGGGQLLVQDEIKLKLPEHDRPASIFFSDRDSNLRRNDPRQQAFEFLREVPDHDPTTGELRDAL